MIDFRCTYLVGGHLPVTYVLEVKSARMLPEVPISLQHGEGRNEADFSAKEGEG